MREKNMREKGSKLYFLPALLVMMIIMVMTAFPAHAEEESHWEIYKNAPSVTTAKTVKLTVYNLAKYKKGYYWANSMFSTWSGKTEVDGKDVEIPVTVENIKSSNPKVATAEYCEFNGGGNGYFHTLSAGKTTITYTLSYNGGQKTTYTLKLTVKKWTNPVKSIKIGKKNYTKKFKSNDTFYAGNVSGKLAITPAKGWKLVSKKYNDGGKLKKLKKSTVKFAYPLDYILLQFKNTKTGDVETIKLAEEEVAG